MARRWTVGFLACALLLPGCATKHEASRTLPPVASEPTTSAGALAPLGPADFRLPPEARHQDAAGAEAALRYFLALVPHQGASGGQPVRALSRGCRLCTFLADRSDEDAAAGYVARGGQITVHDMSQPALHENLAEFAFEADEAPVEVVDSQGKPVPDRGEGELRNLNGGAVMSWDSTLSAWIMTDLEFEPT